MAWPKGVKRGPRKTTTPVDAAQQPPAREPLKAAPKPVRIDPRFKMKARPNWEDYDVAAEPMNELHIPQDQFPDGMDLQWVATSCLGQPLAKEMGEFTRKGWTVVHQTDFDGIYDGRWLQKGKDEPIEYKGLTLMARPLEYSLHAKKQERKKALDQVSIKERALLGGEIPGVTLDSQHDHALRSNTIKRTYEPLTVPKE